MVSRYHSSRLTTNLSASWDNGTMGQWDNGAMGQSPTLLGHSRTEGFAVPPLPVQQVGQFRSPK